MGSGDFCQGIMRYIQQARKTEFGCKKQTEVSPVFEFRKGCGLNCFGSIAEPRLMLVCQDFIEVFEDNRSMKIGY